jgi:hypothetical protein
VPGCAPELHPHRVYVDATSAAMRVRLMKIGFTLAIAAALAASGPLHAQDRIDLASLKCSAYLASSPENIRLILM